MFAYALEMSCKRADKFTAKTVVTSGFEVLMGMFFDLIPIVVSWGTIALIIATTHSISFSWISYPMGMYLQALSSEVLQQHRQHWLDSQICLFRRFCRWDLPP